MTIDDLIARARGGDAKALATRCSRPRATWGSGWAPWSMRSTRRTSTSAARSPRPGTSSKPRVRSGLAERALTPPAGATPITVVPPEQYPRLRGAAALVAAPPFAKEVVA